MAPLVSKTIDPSVELPPRTNAIAVFGVQAYVTQIFQTIVLELFTHVQFMVPSWKLVSAPLASIDVLSSGVVAPMSILADGVEVPIPTFVPV